MQLSDQLTEKICSENNSAFKLSRTALPQWELLQANPLCLHTSLSKYANTAWASTHKTKLKKIQSKQKHALRIIFNRVY